MRPFCLASVCGILATCGGFARADDWRDAQPPVGAGGTGPVIQSTPELTFKPDEQPSTPHFVHNRDSIPDRPDIVVPLTGRYELTTRAAVGGDPGSVRVARSALGANLVFGPEHDLQISIPVDYETSTYSFRQADSLFPGGVDRIRHFQQWTITPNVEVKVNDHWGVFGGGLIFIAGQYGAHDMTTYGGFGGAIWRPDKTFTLRFGLGARTQLEDDIQVLPAIWMEWKIDERTRLTSQGNNIRFEYDISEAWCVKFDAAFEQRAYRLDDDGPGPSAVFKDFQVPLSVRIEFVPHAATRFEAWIGTNISREFVVDLEKDNRFSKSHASPSLMFGVSFEIIF